MMVRIIVANWLKANLYDGLCCDCCGCGINDLIPHNECNPSGCVAAYWVDCNDCDNCDNCDDFDDSTCCGCYKENAK